MSKTYSIVCRDCMEALWVGQGRSESRRYIYTGKKHLDAMERFLFDHEDHNLVFRDDEDVFDGKDGAEYDEEEYLAKPLGHLKTTETD